MARARILKPEFFEDITLSGVSRDARLLYAGLWQHMDRRGLMEYHPKLVKKDVFPYDDDATSERVDIWVKELVTVGRLKLISHGGKTYLYCSTLPKHQHFHHAEKANRLIPALDMPGAGPSNSSEENWDKPEASPVQASDKPGIDPTDTDTDTDTEAEAEAVLVIPEDDLLTRENLAHLYEQFGKELVEEHLKDAKACWHAKGDYFKATHLPIQTVQNYLKIERKNLLPKETKLSPTDEALKSWTPSYGGDQ